MLLCVLKNKREREREREGENKIYLNGEKLRTWKVLPAQGYTQIMFVNNFYCFLVEMRPVFAYKSKSC